jgi:hypothetical protein
MVEAMTVLIPGTVAVKSNAIDNILEIGMNLFRETNVLKYDIAGTERKIVDKNPNDTFHHDTPNN